MNTFFDWKFQAHFSGRYDGAGISGGNSQYKCANTGAFRVTKYVGKGKIKYYPSVDSEIEFETEEDLESFLKNPGNEKRI